MTKAEIINSLLDQALDRDSFVDDEDPDCIFAHDAKALREAAELLKAMPEWISVKDRLPEVYQPVIVCREIGKGEYVVEQGQKDAKGWWKCCGTRTKLVQCSAIIHTKYIP